MNSYLEMFIMNRHIVLGFVLGFLLVDVVKTNSFKGAISLILLISFLLLDYLNRFRLNKNIFI